ncbi:MAG: DUF917 family protein [Candidatus Heimdallarchaeota archaeon]|nr:DUF917 family protein [Candidatus Heimdallarchaeota archaeon]
MISKKDSLVVFNLVLRHLDDFKDLIRGAKILGCGGGGEEGHALERTKELLAQGLTVNVIDPKNIPDDALLCVAGMAGGRSTPELLAKVKSLPVVDERPILTATKLLEEYLDEKLHTLVATEIGAGNFLVPIYVSAVLGINVLDGDLAGRAKPEISISTTNIKAIPITPLAITSRFGDKMVLKTAPNDQRAEAIVREMAVISDGLVGCARCPAYWHQYKQAAIPNSITKSLRLGRAVREARIQGNNPIPPILEIIEGGILFDGKVKAFGAEDKGGFVIGETLLENERKEKFKVWFKNEFLISWKNGERYVTCPDLICIVDKKTGEALTPWTEDFQLGREVIVIGAPNYPIWRTPKGLEIFGPKHFGFDFSYHPVEKFFDD